MDYAEKTIICRDRDLIISKNAVESNIATDKDVGSISVEISRFYNKNDLSTFELVMYIKGVNDDVVAIRDYVLTDSLIVWNFIPSATTTSVSGWVDIQLSAIKADNGVISQKWQSKLLKKAFYIGESITGIVDSEVIPLPTELEQYRAEMLEILRQANNAGVDIQKHNTNTQSHADIRNEITVLSEVKPPVKTITITSDTQLDNIPTVYYNDTSKKIYEVDVYNTGTSIFGSSAYRLIEYHYNFNFGHQIAYSYGQKAPKCRQKVNGVWASWGDLATTEKTEILFPYASGYSDYNATFKTTVVRSNNLVVVSLYCKGTLESSSRIVGILPVGYRPLTPIELTGRTSSDKLFTISFNPDGNVAITGVVGATATYASCNVSYYL